VHSNATVLKQAPDTSPRHFPRHPWNAARQVPPLPPTEVAHCSRQLLESAPPFALQPWTHAIPSRYAFAKHARAVELQSGAQDRSLCAASDGQLVAQSTRAARQAVSAAREPPMHEERQDGSPVVQPFRQAARAAWACIVQTARPRAHPLAHC
jgi:hypothetical protein